MGKSIVQPVGLQDYVGGEASAKDKHRYYQRRMEEQVPKYVAPEPLIDVINMAKYLGRPLLLEGEPGCGKTTLARHVAWTLDAPYFEWHVKSTESARRGLYTFDTVARLRDAQLAKNDRSAGMRVRKLMNYVTHGPLGEAFRSSQRQAVVLIDEIDKADSDFPNDMLLELDRMSYVISEVSQTEVSAKFRPLVFITSNREKPLPRAFLRRCLYYFIDFPPQSALEEIVKAHEIELSPEVLKAALTRFLDLREDMRTGSTRGDKIPDVAELLDWLRVLLRKNVTEKELKMGLPERYVLLKTENDQKGFPRDDQGLDRDG